MSQSSVVPSLKARPVTLSSPSTSVVSFLRWTLTPIASMLDRRIVPPVDVELHLHEMAGEVNDVDLAAVIEEPARGFEAEQAAADHGGAAALLRLENDGVAVVDGAEAEHARLELAVGHVARPPSAG